MMKPGRHAQTIRVIRAMILMSQPKWWHLADLAERGNVSVKTVRRDIRAIELIGVPVMENRSLGTVLYRIESTWIKRFMGAAK